AREAPSATTGIADSKPSTTGDIHAANAGDTIHATTPATAPATVNPPYTRRSYRNGSVPPSRPCDSQPESLPASTSATPRDCTHIVIGAISAASKVSRSTPAAIRSAPPQPRRIGGSTTVAR